MTTRQVAVQGALALVGLSAAYFTWQRGAELEPGEVVVVDAAKNDLLAARYDDQEKPAWVELSRSTDDAGSFVAVRLSAQDKPVAGKENVTSRIPERLVRGSDTADKLLAMLAPLRASRGLGVLDAAKLKDLGLDAPKKHITVSLRNGQRKFAIAPAPPGGSEPYLRDESTGQVYLVPRSLLSDFQAAASSLVERRLHTFKLEEADHVVVRHGGTKKELVVSRGDDGLRISPASTPDKPDATAKAWQERVFSLWPVEVLGQGETPAEGVPQIEVRVDYSARGRGLGFVEIARLPTRESVSDKPKDTLFARSEHTLGWYKLSVDSQTILSD